MAKGLDYSATMALEALDVQYFKDSYLTGFTFYGADGQPLPDVFFEEHLQRAVAQLEATTNIDIISRVYVGEKHDYHFNDTMAYGFLQLFHIPCRSVQALRAGYSGQTTLVYPSEWVRLETAHSQLQLVPTPGTLSQIIIGQGGVFLPLLFSGLSYVPQFWEIDYTSGFDPNAVPRIITTAIAKMAAIEALLILSDIIRPLGITSQSLSVDGLSQSKGFAMPAFRGRIDAYKADLFGPSFMGGGLVDQIRNSYLGVNMVVM